jgi:hypothetical protein
MDNLDKPKKDMIECLKKNLGNISNACQQVGIVRQTHYNWLDNDPYYRQEFENIREAAIDFVESKLLQNIQNGSDTAAIFFLKTQGKKRGYVERSEVDISGTPTIKIEWPE